MILFRAEAILASSTSKSGVRITRTEHEDFRASTDSTNSTSLVHSIASVRNCEQVHTSVLNLIYQQTNVAGVRKTCQSEDLKSAVVVGLPHNSLKGLPLTGDD